MAAGDSRHIRSKSGIRFHPVTSPAAWSAAEVSACAYVQSEEAFWKAHDMLYSRQEDLLQSKVTAEQIVSGVPGIDRGALRGCIEKRGASFFVGRDTEIAKVGNIVGVPTIFVNGERVDGAFRDKIEAAVREASKARWSASEQRS
jgi:Thioredoxin